MYLCLKKSFYFKTAAKKLQEEGSGMKLFLPDGYEIDEDEILNSAVTKGQTLIISRTQPDSTIRMDSSGM